MQINEIWVALNVTDKQFVYIIYIYIYIYIYSSEHKDQNDVKKKSKCEMNFILKLYRTFYQGIIWI